MPKFESNNNALSDLKDSIREAVGESELKERRTICKRFYLTEEEEKRLEELRQGVNLSAFVRAKLMGESYRPRSIVPQIDRETYIHLSNLRANCNQMARAINSAAKQERELPLTQAYLSQLEQLEELLIRIGQRLSQGQDAISEEAE